MSKSDRHDSWHFPILNDELKGWAIFGGGVFFRTNQHWVKKSIRFQACERCSSVATEVVFFGGRSSGVVFWGVFKAKWYDIIVWYVLYTYNGVFWPMVKLYIFSKEYKVQTFNSGSIAWVRWLICMVKIWVFPKIVVPQNHPILIGFSIINHPFWGIPIFGTPICMVKIYHTLILKESCFATFTTIQYIGLQLVATSWKSHTTRNGLKNEEGVVWICTHVLI